MKMSTIGLAELIGHEAIVTRRYKDSVGVWTVGVGHTKAAGAPDPTGVTTDQPVADLIEIFRRDIAVFERAVGAALKVAVTQNEFDALVSFHFNTGAISRASLTKSLNAGDRSTAAAQFLQWNKPPEIVDRRKSEMILFRDGVYSGDGKAAVYPATNGGAVLWSRGKRVPVLPLLGGDATPDMPPLSAAPAGATISSSQAPVLRRGSKGPAVAAWQRAIGIDDDGEFGIDTEKATMEWQKVHGLIADGLVGPKSWGTVRL